MKKIILLFIFLTGSSYLFSQVLSDNDLQEIRKGFVKDVPTSALQNAISNEKDLRKNALNRELQGKIDHYFKYRVDVKGITNQLSSGRCWMFTSMNVLRPAIMKKYNINAFDFSHNYNYFWDILEKSNLFLENIIATSGKDIMDREVATYFSSPVNDGGVWNLYFNIAEKYGVVPKEVMPETEHSNNTSHMISIVNEKLRMGGYLLREMKGKKAKEIRKEKNAILQEVYRILALCLGEPPTEFTWRYKDKEGNIKVLANYTPLQFYKEITPEDYHPDNYIMIMNDPTRPYYKMYDLSNYKNTIEGIGWVYLNLPNEDIKRAALASIKNNEAMYASCDVGKQFNRESGILDPSMYDYESMFGIKLQMDKKARILTRQSGSAHAMALIGCDTDENDTPVKWEFENSWGNHGNKGYLTFTDKWFDEYMFRIVIHKKYLDSKALESLKQKPEGVPVWDYMY